MRVVLTDVNGFAKSIEVLTPLPQVIPYAIKGPRTYYISEDGKLVQATAETIEEISFHLVKVDYDHDVAYYDER